MDEELLFLYSLFIEQRILSCLLLRSTQQVHTFITRFYDLTGRYRAWAGPGFPAAAAYCRCQNPCIKYLITISLPQSLSYITVLFSLLSRPLDIMQPSHIFKLAQYLQVIYGSSWTSSWPTLWMRSLKKLDE